MERLALLAGRQQAKLLGASFVGAILDGAILDNADLEGADFSYSTLSNVQFKNAKLRDANFNLADFPPQLMKELHGTGAKLPQEVPPEVLEQVVQDHMLWIESDGHKGRRDKAGMVSGVEAGPATGPLPGAPGGGKPGRESSTTCCVCKPGWAVPRASRNPTRSRKRSRLV